MLIGNYWPLVLQVLPNLMWPYKSVRLSQGTKNFSWTTQELPTDKKDEDESELIYLST